MLVSISEELFATKTAEGAGLCDAMREAARARGFTIVAPADVRDGRTAARLLPLGAGATGARVRADLGPHAQPIAAAAARALGASVTLVAVSGTASGEAGHLLISLAVRAVQIDRNGHARALRVESSEGDYEQDDDGDWAVAAELLRAGYDHAGNVLAEAALALDLSLVSQDPRVVHTLLRPTATPRVAELASLAAIAKGHELTPQPDGRVLVRITLEDGKRLAYLSAAEGLELERLLAR